MFYLMIFLPLVNSILAGCCGNTLGMLGVRSTSALTLIFNQLVCWYLLLSSTVFYADFGTWMSFGSLSIKWSFLVDQTTVIMFFVVNTVSTIVHVYSFYYMGQDPSLPRFISYLSLFTFFMNILVSAGNLIVLFIG